MIVTVTPNTGLDQTLIIDHMPFNQARRVKDSMLSMAGKPADASYILGQMGVSSRAMGFAAGTFGEQVTAMLREKGVTPDFVTVGGQTRLNTVIVTTDEHTHTTLTTDTLKVEPDHVSALIARFTAILPSASVVVMGGSLPSSAPQDLYIDLITRAREQNVPVIFDADEPLLSAGLQAHPTFIKPNEHELGHLIGAPVESLDEAYTAGQRIVEQYGTRPIITLGGRGALAFLESGTVFVPPLTVDVISPAGAGDAVLAGLAWAIDAGQPIAEGVKLGIATASAVLMQTGTAVYSVDDQKRLLEQVELVPYPA